MFISSLDLYKHLSSTDFTVHHTVFHVFREHCRPESVFEELSTEYKFTFSTPFCWKQLFISQKFPWKTPNTENRTKHYFPIFWRPITTSLGWVWDPDNCLYSTILYVNSSYKHVGIYIWTCPYHMHITNISQNKSIFSLFIYRDLNSLSAKNALCNHTIYNPSLLVIKK